MGLGLELGGEEEGGKNVPKSMGSISCGVGRGSLERGFECATVSGKDVDESIASKGG